MKHIALPLAVVLALTAAAQAGGRHRSQTYYAPPPVAGQGTVNNFYGSVTIYQGAPAPAYGYDYSNAAPVYSGAGYANGGAYAGAYANGYSSATGSYGSDYGAPWGPPFAGGVGYSPYGNYGGGYGGPVYGGSVYGARMDPWNGYNGAPGNGYW